MGGLGGGDGGGLGTHLRARRFVYHRAEAKMCDNTPPSNSGELEARTTPAIRARVVSGPGSAD